MFKKLIIWSLFLFVGGWGLAYYYWSQFTELPSWYRENPQENKSALSLKDTQGLKGLKKSLDRQISQQIEAQKASGKSELMVKLNRREINDLIVTSVAENNRLKKILTLVKSIDTEVSEDKIQIGAIFNPSQIPQDSLSSEQQSILTKALAKVPQLKNRDIYFTLEGKPQIENGKLTLAKDSKIKLGKISFSVRDIAEKLGYSENTFLNLLDLEFKNLPIQHIELHDQKATFHLKSVDS